MSFPSSVVPINERSFWGQGELETGYYASNANWTAQMRLRATQQFSRSNVLAFGARYLADGADTKYAGHSGFARVYATVLNKDKTRYASMEVHFSEWRGTGGTPASNPDYHQTAYLTGNPNFDLPLEEGVFHNFELMLCEDDTSQLRVNGQVVATGSSVSNDAMPYYQYVHADGFVEASALVRCSRYFETVSCRSRVYIDPVIGWDYNSESYSAAQQDDYIVYGQISSYFPVTKATHGLDDTIFNSPSPHVIYGGCTSGPPPDPDDPKVTLAKSAIPGTYDEPGDTITYNYRLTNTGNVMLTGPFQVDDDKVVGSPTVIGTAPAWLEPGEFVDFVATYVITQADITAGSVTNNATGFAHYGIDTAVFDSTSATVTSAYVPPEPDPESTHFQARHDGPTLVKIEKVYTIYFNRTFADAMLYNGVESDDWIFNE